jgi:hypothetical protein
MVSRGNYPTREMTGGEKVNDDGGTKLVAGVIEWWRIRRGRVRGTWRTCRRCGSYSYQTGKSGLCGGRLSLK